MFWSGNYIVGRELNFLLKEENVTLSQVLEADDILQECKADNKALIQFLTKPEVLAELITLITEEPPQSAELSTQYKHANVACEVLTSQLAMLSDRLSLDVTQMHRLCDFITRDPPLNPLLASYFSKTVEMLLERSPKQDWYLYHIVCLRVLDFFKSRRDFLPNLLRHISTSAIADTFKYFIRLDDLFKKTVMEWLDEHQFLDCLIQIICGTYVPEECHPVLQTNCHHEQYEKGDQEKGEEPDVNHKEETQEGARGPDAEGEIGSDPREPAPAESPPAGGGRQAAAAAGAGAGAGAGGAAGRADCAGRAERDERVERAARIAAVASANAAALLCDLIVNGCAGEGCSTRPRASWWLAARLQAAGCAGALLAGMFTSPARARRHALVNGCHVLLAMLAHDPALCTQQAEAEAGAGAEAAGAAEGAGARSGAELAVAPHLPLLHQALLQDPLATHEDGPPSGDADGRGAGGGGVGLARVQVATLLARLAASQVEEVATTMLTLGTPGVLVDMFFRYPNNNFLHAQLLALLRNALDNRAYCTHYARHLLVECDLLTRLMDAYKENQKCSGARAGYMGHVVAALARLARAPGLLAGPALPPPLASAWSAFLEDELRPLLQQHDTPLGGYYPSENIYEVEDMSDTLAANYDFNDIAATAAMDDLADDINAEDANEMLEASGSGGAADSADFIADGLGLHDDDKMVAAENNFLELASQRFDDDLWEGGAADGAALAALAQPSPWESVGEGGSADTEAEAEAEAGAGAGAGAGWAQFGACAFAAPPADPFAAPGEPFAAHHQDFSPFWSYADGDAAADATSQAEVEAGMRELRLEGGGSRMDAASSAELANNLLTAMSAMSPDAIANIVNANLPPDHPADTRDDRAGNQTDHAGNRDDRAPDRDDQPGSCDNQAGNRDNQAGNRDHQASSRDDPVSNRDERADSRAGQPAR